MGGTVPWADAGAAYGDPIADPVRRYAGDRLDLCGLGSGMAVKQLEHPALDHLAATPDIFRALLTGVSDEQAYWKPTPDRFSIAELLEHLSHVEAHCFRIRFDEALAADDPEVEPYDQNAFYAQGTYSNREA